MKIPTQIWIFCVGIFLQHYTFLQKRTFCILCENFSRFVRKATITLTAKSGEIYKDNIKLNLSYSVPKNIVYIDNGHRSGKFKFYTLSFSAIITGNEVNGFIDFCLKNNVRFLV